MTGTTPLFHRMKLLLRRLQQQTYGWIPEFIREMGVHIAIPISLFVLWMLDGSVLGWVALVIGTAIRFGLRSSSVLSLGKLLTESGIILLPEDDTVLVEEFLRIGTADNIQVMQTSLRPGSHASIYKLDKHPNLINKSGVILGWTEDGRVLLQLDGETGYKSLRPQSISQSIAIYGREFKYTRG